MNSTKHPFPLRLKQARAIACLSLRALSGRIGISHTQLNKYEKGLAEPPASAFIKIANALGVSVEFFFREEMPNLNEIHFRKNSGLSQAAAIAIQNRAKDYFSRYLEIEQIAARENIPFPRFSSKDKKTPESWADELREKWSLGNDPIPNLQQLLENKGIKIFEADNVPEKFDGFSARHKNEAFIVIADWLKFDLPRKRMTLAHELGHLLICHDEAVSENEHESFAKKFAAAFLMPKESFSKMFGWQRTKISLPDLFTIKRYFGVSLAAIVMRACDLELIPERAKKSFFILRNKKGWNKNEPGHYLGEESCSRFERLVRRSVLENEISESKGANLLGVSVNQLRTMISDAV